MGRQRVTRWVVIVPTILMLVGCSARVPLETPDFSPEEKVVVTFDDGTRVTGRLDGGETVLVQREENQYRATVEEVDETSIVLGELVQLEAGNAEFQRNRMEQFRLYVAEDTDEQLVLSRDRILQVERVVTDAPRTLRRVLFWTIGTGIVLIAARDHNI